MSFAGDFRLSLSWRPAGRTVTATVKPVVCGFRPRSLAILFPNLVLVYFYFFMDIPAGHEFLVGHITKPRIAILLFAKICHSSRRQRSKQQFKS